MRDAARGVVIATSAPGAAADGLADISLVDSLELDADLMSDRLESGCRIHCCTSLEPLVTQVLSAEVELRGGDAAAKLAEWRRNDQLHCAPTCAIDVEEARRLSERGLF